MESFEEALKVDANFSAENRAVAERLTHTRRLVHVLFEQMATVSEHLHSIEASILPEGESDDYGKRSKDLPGDQVIASASSDRHLVSDRGTA